MLVQVQLVPAFDTSDDLSWSRERDCGPSRARPALFSVRSPTALEVIRVLFMCF